MRRYKSLIRQFIPKGIGNKEVIQGIKDIIDIFLSEFNNYFHSNVFHKYTEHIEKLMDIKYKKYLEINNKYQAQIKEMELLLSNIGIKLFTIKRNLMINILILSRK